MNLSYSTLACPDWDLGIILKKALEFGYRGVDLRGTSAGLDVTLQRQFREELLDTSQLISRSGVVVNSIYSSIYLCDVDGLDAILEEAARMIRVARAIGAGSVRVFGGGHESDPRSRLMDAAKRCLDKILSLEGAGSVRWLLETHDNWLSSQDCISMVESIGWEKLGLIWDLGHTLRLTDESSQEFLENAGPLVAGVHIKDAVYDPGHPNSMGDGWRYVLPGCGQLPMREAITALKSIHYQGWIVFEHEKHWHPELEEPEVALPAFKQWFDSLYSVV